MEIIISIVGGVLGGIILFSCIAAIFVFCRINNRRYNGNKFIKYFTASDFPGLVAEPLSFFSDQGQCLHGFLYRETDNDQPKALLLFAHGFGAGHLAYTTELNTLAKAGYWILAFDATGCGMSEGKNLRGFDQGVIDLRHAIEFANKQERFRGLKKILIGHSWGAFCVMNSVSSEGICGAVAMCGFISGAKVLSQNTLGKKFAFLALLQEAFLYCLNWFRFRNRANYNSITSMQTTKKPVYLIYGEQDSTVRFSGNGAIFYKKLKNFKNISFKLCKDKGHNPYLTTEAEKDMQQTFAAIAKQKKKDPVKVKEMYDKISYDKITAEDSEVMASVIGFCDQIVMG